MQMLKLCLNILWRVEIELKRDMVDYWNDCFSDLHILQPDWKTIQRTADRAIVLCY